MKLRRSPCNSLVPWIFICLWNWNVALKELGIPPAWISYGPAQSLQVASLAYQHNHYEEHYFFSKPLHLTLFQRCTGPITSSILAKHAWVVHLHSLRLTQLWYDENEWKERQADEQETYSRFPEAYGLFSTVTVPYSNVAVRIAIIFVTWKKGAKFPVLTYFVFL